MKNTAVRLKNLVFVVFDKRMLVFVSVDVCGCWIKYLQTCFLLMLAIKNVDGV